MKARPADKAPARQPPHPGGRQPIDEGPPANPVISPETAARLLREAGGSPGSPR